MKNDGHGRGIGLGRGKESGYTLVMFVVVIAIMSISMGVAVQTAEFQMKREREAELIFRGEQFIEAIRLYKMKYGRYPMQLKEIYEAKPRVIRKQWKDPITDSENWGIVFLGQEGRQMGQRGRQLVGPGAQGSGLGPIGTQTPGGNRQGGVSNPGNRGYQTSDGKGVKNPGLQDDDSGQFGLGQADAERMVGPIIGVHSTSCDEAVKIYEGHTTYCEWRFVYREQARPGAGGGRGGGNRPVGWHPGDTLGGDDAKNPGGPGSTGPGGGNRPPRPIQTPARP